MCNVSKTEQSDFHINENMKSGLVRSLGNRIDIVKRDLHVSLTKSCNYRCSYCNQRFDSNMPVYDMSENDRVIIDNKIRSGKEWIEGLNEYPYKKYYRRLIFSGGEPSLHPDFFDIVTEVEGYKKISITTNLTFDVERFIDVCVKKNKKLVVEPSFHFEGAQFDEFLAKLNLLEKSGLLSKTYPVSIVDLPGNQIITSFIEKFRKNGFNIKSHKFEGYYKGTFDFAPISGFGSICKKDVICRSMVNDVKSNGDVVFCPTDDYLNGVELEQIGHRTYGNICDKNYRKINDRRPCSIYGKCHISSASWIKVSSAENGKIVWHGKNYPTTVESLYFPFKPLVKGLLPSRCFEWIKSVYLSSKLSKR